MQTRRSAIQVLLAVGVTVLCLTAVSCRRENASPPGKNVPAGPPTQQVAEPAEPVLVPADIRDDPRSARVLPRSNEVPGWIKTKPVEVIEPQKAASLMPSESLSKAINTFELAQASRCTYESLKGKAEVLVLEMARPADAFGIFSLMSRSKDQQVRWQDGSIREIRMENGRHIMLGWQGTICLFVNATSPVTKEVGGDARQIFERILFTIPSTEPPLLIQAIPKQRQAQSKVWVVRRTSALRAADDADELKQVANAKLDQRLGLDGKTLLWVASIASANTATAPASQPAGNVLIWVVQYPDSTAATAGYERCRRAIAKADTALDRKTQLLEPTGPYLVGSWTADGESATEILNGIRAILPTTIQTHPSLPSQPAR